jgi:malonyl-CoA O-methyltransferase
MNDPRELDPLEGYALWAANYPAHAHNPFMLAEERAMLALLPQSLQGLRVLDVGCDQSGQMLARARDLGLPVTQGSVTSVPVIDGWADVVVCALTLGHVADLRSALGELARVLNDSGTLLCSDFHPIADALGWKRTFTVGEQRYAVRYTTHRYSDWHAASKAVGLCIEDVIEPQLNADDIVADQRFDPRALEVPVAIVFRMRKAR